MRAADSGKLDPGNRRAETREHFNLKSELGTDEITLADIELYQRFDADWVSFEDETPTTSPMLDMAS